MLCDARIQEELDRRQIPSLRGKNLQWRSLFTTLTSCCLLYHRCRCSNQDGSVEWLPEGMKAEVVGRQHPSMYHGRLDGLVRQGSENLCVMGQTRMLTCPICRYKPAARSRTATQRLLYPHSTRHGPS